MRKPENMTDLDWSHWVNNGVGRCDVCGKTAYFSSTDAQEITKPEDKVVHFKIATVYKRCEEHKRE